MSDWPIAWSCPHCGAELRAKREAKGSKARCPKCEKTIQGQARSMKPRPTKARN